MTTPDPYEAFKTSVLATYGLITPPNLLADPEEVVEEVRRSFEANLAAVSPKNCEIAKITATRIGWDAEAADDFESYVGLPGPLFRLDGHDDSGHTSPRIQLLFMDAEIGVTFILTPGRNASSVYYGQKRTCRYGMVVLGMFGLSALGVLRHGYQRIVDDPIDDDVRRLYTRMGFEGGKVLDLRDKARVQTLAEFVARALSSSRIDPSLVKY